MLMARKELAVKLGVPGHCYCALQYKTRLGYFFLVHYIAMIEYLSIDQTFSVAFCNFFDHYMALHNILFYHGLKLGEHILSQIHDLR